MGATNASRALAVLRAAPVLDPKLDTVSPAEFLGAAWPDILGCRVAVIGPAGSEFENGAVIVCSADCRGAVVMAIRLDQAVQGVAAALAGKDIEHVELVADRVSPRAVDTHKARSAFSGALKNLMYLKRLSHLPGKYRLRARVGPATATITALMMVAV